MFLQTLAELLQTHNSGDGEKGIKIFVQMESSSTLFPTYAVLAFGVAERLSPIC